jgi:hypothetical protein
MGCLNVLMFIKTWVYKDINIKPSEVINWNNFLYFDNIMCINDM